MELPSIHTRAVLTSPASPPRYLDGTLADLLQGIRDVIYRGSHNIYHVHIKYTMC